jgi:hypothetical protein
MRDSRKNWPNVADAYTPPNNRRIPPQRIASRSGMAVGADTVRAFLDCVNQDLDNPDSLDPEGTFSINAPNNDLPNHGSRLSSSPVSTPATPR